MCLCSVTTKCVQVMNAFADHDAANDECRAEQRYALLSVLAPINSQFCQHHNVTPVRPGANRRSVNTPILLGMQELRTQWIVVAGGAIIVLGSLIFAPTQRVWAGGANPAAAPQGQEAPSTRVTTPARTPSNAPGAPAIAPPAGSPAGAVTPATAAAPDPRWEVVRKLLRSAQYPSAEAVARSMVKERPDDLRAGFYLGLALHKEKRHGEALAYLERASAAPVDSFSEAAHAVHYLGWCRYYLGDLPGARAAFTTHANAFPNYDDTQFALGLIAYEEDRVIDSEAYFRRALQLLEEQQGSARERAKNLARLGDVLLRQDRLPEAEQCYRRAVELFETHGEAWSKLARVLDRLGRASDAANARARQAEIKARTETEKPSP
jgi:tetratricopeptide (TPR) repeat protein